MGRKRIKIPKVNIEPDYCKNVRKKRENNSNMTKNFEVYDITWVIEKFRLAMCSDKWVIESPVFSITGSQSTQWLIWLEHLKEQNDVTNFHLYRCDVSSAFKRVKVHWRLSICTPDEAISVMDRYMFCIFSSGLKYKVCLKKFKYIIDNLISPETENLTIKCEIIFFTDNKCTDYFILNNFESSDRKGKKSLSKDLLNLYLKGIDCDLALKVGDKTIMVHKAIMSARIQRLIQLLDEAKEGVDFEKEEMDVIDLSSLDYDSMVNVMHYAYSGNLIYIFNKPNLYMYDCIKLLDITHVKEYFKAKTLIFRSIWKNTREIKFICKTTNFSENCNHAIDIPISLDNFSTNMKLLFLPEDTNDVKYFPIFLKLAKEMESNILSLELAVINKSENTVFSKISWYSTANFGYIGFTKFIQRDLLKSYLDDNTLQLSVKLKLADHTWDSVIEKNDVSTKTDICMTDYLDLLSTHMKMLYENCYFFDVVLGVNDYTFSIHKGILSARCIYLANSLDNASEENFDTISNIESYTVHMFLSYLYSGAIETEDREILKDLCDLALSFKLPLLRDMCEDALGEYVSNLKQKV